MMSRIEIHNSVNDFNSYRAARVKSLFNAESGCNFDLVIDGVDLSGEWNIGIVVGASGSGKTSIGKQIFGENRIVNLSEGWSFDKPIVDDIAPDGDFNRVTSLLASVGLGDVPAWLRPFCVLSNGEQFRAGLARLICDKPAEAVVDEFTSVIDRQIAKIGAQAFQKAWRRENPSGKVVLLTPHYDIVEWVQPDWVIDTNRKTFERGYPRQRPKIELEIRKVNGSYWRYFKPHYYLDLPMPIAAEYFVGTVDGELACHLAVCPWFHLKGYRATRLVTMPEWQGAGVGSRFLDAIAQYHLEGNGRRNRKLPTYFHTSHPQLCAALRRSDKWVQVSARLYGDNKKRNAESMRRSELKNGRKLNGGIQSSGFGGHFRAVQGFKYIGGENTL
jgi:ABC-type Mn2+/Zn2+ transport system ATPase subunit